MGFAICRFNQDEGCNETGSQEWYAHLPDVDRTINVPSMWKHYMEAHLVQPTSEEREVIMSADPTKATGELITTKGVARPVELMVLYVERIGDNEYSHKIGDKPDTEFIIKLEKILDNAQPLQTKGINQEGLGHYKPGYR